MRKWSIVLCLFALISCAGSTAPKPDLFVNLDSILRVDCANKRGTAEVIAPNMVLTAEHVIGKNLSCQVGGKPAIIIHRDRELDIAVLAVDTSDLKPFQIDCGGFREGTEYLAVGYAEGTTFGFNKIIATGKRREVTDTEDYQKFILGELDGKIYQGMSGGPIISPEGKLVGIINMTSTKGPVKAYSRPISDMYLCRKS